MDKVDIWSPIATVYLLKTVHLTVDQAAFGNRGEAMIASKEMNTVKFKKELRMMGERERERNERCWMGRFGSRRPLADRMQEEQGRGYTGSVTVLCGGGESAVQARQV